MARRKISRKMPPLRQIQGMFEQGINNYDQANIDQNAAASFNQQFRTGSYNSTYGSGGKFNQGAMNAAGVNQNFGANNANVSQDRITGAITQNNGFQPTFLPNQRHWNQGATAADEGLLTPFKLCFFIKDALLFSCAISVILLCLLLYQRNALTHHLQLFQQTHQ